MAYGFQQPDMLGLPMQIKNLEILDLLRLNADTINELRLRDVLTTGNAPLGDYAEWLFIKAFGWQTEGNSNKDVDAVGSDGTRYQIKARRIHRRNRSRQLSALRRLHEANFDVLAAALFNEDFTVMRAAFIPHKLVVENSSRVEATNSWRFHLRDVVWTWNGVIDATEPLRLSQ